MGKVTTLFEDSAKTIELYPRTKTSAVSDADGNSLGNIAVYNAVNMSGTVTPFTDDLMRTVSSPTENHILLTDANGQAIDGGVTLSSKQNKLTSGTNIKTVAGNSILGSGNIASSSICISTKLWENSSTTSAYPSSGTSINILTSELSDYRFVLIMYRYYTGDSGYSSMILPLLGYDLRLIGVGASHTARRTVTASQSNGLTIYGCYLEDGTVNNSYNVPYRVYGIK